MIVDVHSHVYPRTYIELLAQRDQIPRVHTHNGQEYFDIFPAGPEAVPGAPTGRPMPSAFWDMDQKFAYMDQHGISTSVMTIGNPWLDFLSAQEEPAWVSRLNEELESICAESAGRLYGMALLPVRDVAASLAEVERVSKLPHIRGFGLPAKPANGLLDAPALRPLWERLAETGLPVMLHPHYAVGGADLIGFGATLPLSLGFPFETSLAVARLVLSGTFDAVPGLKLLLSHAGGTLPFLAHRLDVCSPGRLRKPASEYLRELYYDALVYDSGPLHATVALAGASHVLFGTDHPFEVARPEQSLAAVTGLGLDAEATAAIFGENARRLFRLG